MDTTAARRRYSADTQMDIAALIRRAVKATSAYKTLHGRRQAIADSGTTALTSVAQ